MDEEDVARLVEYLIAAGSARPLRRWAAPANVWMPVAERKWLAEVVVGAASGRVPVIVGTSAENTAEAVELSQHAEAIGARAVFLTPPLFGAVTPEALLHHYGAVARSVGIAVMVQDAQVSIPPRQQVALAEAFPNLCYSKEEAPLESGHRISELRRLRPALKILSGGARLLEDLAPGARAIPVWKPRRQPARPTSVSWRAIVNARAAYDRPPLSFWRQPFPLLGTKEVLRRLGVFKAAHLRAPVNEALDDQDHRELTAIMERMGPPY
ncbi:MAG: dihydrodipicolinate synthase family protein [Chloroflexia bacterium]